jgi:hypothetical protein
MVWRGARAWSHAPGPSPAGAAADKPDFADKPDKPDKSDVSDQAVHADKSDAESECAQRGEPDAAESDSNSVECRNSQHSTLSFFTELPLFVTMHW